jgi:5,10-methylenetetrahydromethanopterin reductase
MKLSCALAPSPAIAEHVATAEALGYHRAWLADSPAIWGDVWIALAQAAEATDTIGLGTAVVIPELRHLTVTASAIAGIEQLAPGRLTLGVGAGFTGMHLLGRKPMRWSDVEAWITALRALLRGEEVAWDGSTLRLCHAGPHDPGFPLEIPIYVAAEGPKGIAVARAHGDGLLSAAGEPPADLGIPVARAQFGTVLADGETLDDARVRDVAGPACVALLHAAYAMAGAAAVDALPGGRRWRERIEAVPAARRHLAIHAGHMTYLTGADAAAVTPQLLGVAGITGTRDEVRAALSALEQAGVDEVLMFVGGDDVPRELRAFAEAGAPSWR